tara:strand:- start:671 stop:892 length:222 start_codon:yes stop_codon:yes gene_type:complete
MKYKNKDGIELSYDGHENDVHVKLVKEVIKEAIKLTRQYDKQCIKSHKMALRNIRKFLIDNFSIKEQNDNKEM